MAGANSNGKGRGRKSRIDMSTEAGRLLLHDLINFKDTGFNPFQTSTIHSKHFWNSRPQFQKVSHGAFISQVDRMAAIAIAQMPTKERKGYEKEAREAIMKGRARLETPPVQTLKPQEHGGSIKSGRVPSLRDTIVVPYPNNDMVLLLFEIDGDAGDENSNKLEFSASGKKVVIFSRLPREWKQAKELIGNKKTNVKTDADCMLLDQVIKDRLEGTSEDNRGLLWEPREVVELPFTCHGQLFNKYGGEIDSYLFRKNKDGYSWGYFWLIGTHVPTKQPKKSGRISGAMEEMGDDESAFNSSEDDSSGGSFMDTDSDNDGSDTGEDRYGLIHNPAFAEQRDTTKESKMEERVKELQGHHRDLQQQLMKCNEQQQEDQQKLEHKEQRLQALNQQFQEYKQQNEQTIQQKELQIQELQKHGQEIQQRTNGEAEESQRIIQEKELQIQELQKHGQELQQRTNGQEEESQRIIQEKELQIQELQKHGQELQQRTNGQQEESQRIIQEKELQIQELQRLVQEWQQSAKNQQQENQQIRLQQEMKIRHMKQEDRACQQSTMETLEEKDKQMQDLLEKHREYKRTIAEQKEESQRMQQVLKELEEELKNQKSQLMVHESYQMAHERQVPDQETHQMAHERQQEENKKAPPPTDESTPTTTNESNELVEEREPLLPLFHEHPGGQWTLKTKGSLQQRLRVPKQQVARRIRSKQFQIKKNVKKKQRSAATVQWIAELQKKSHRSQEDHSRLNEPTDKKQDEAQCEGTKEEGGAGPNESNREQPESGKHQLEVSKELKRKELVAEAEEERPNKRLRRSNRIKIRLER